MDKDRKPCNRATCGNKLKCSQMIKDAKRSAPVPSRPGAEAATYVFPNAGNSTQILYVEPNFTETPSEYDVFYDCYSDVEISQPSAVVFSKSVQIGAPPPVKVKDSRTFRDALKQVINTAQTLLVEFEGSRRRERRGCGSRCRCDVRNIKPQSRTVQLEVTAKVAASKSNFSPNIRIDPISFTIPLKLHLQGQGQGQRQEQFRNNLPYLESQQSYEIRKHMAVQDHDQMAKMFASMEPIRTATIVAPRPELSNIPMEGSAPAFNLHTSLFQQMAAMQPDFLPFPLQAPDDFLMQAPAAQVVASKVQIEVPASPPLTTLGRPEAATASTVSKTKETFGEVCTVEFQRVPLVDTFSIPSLAPVTQGPLLTTIATSSVPSVGASKSQPLLETATQPVSSKKTACSKGKFVSPEPSEYPVVPPPIRGPWGKCTKTEASLVVLVPPIQQSVELSKPAIETPGIGKSPSKGACNISSSTAALPHSKQQAELLNKVSRGTVCTKGSSAPVPEQSDISQLEDTKRVLKGPCRKCTRKIPPPLPPLPLQERLLDVKEKGPCGKRSKTTLEPVKKESSQCLLSEPPCVVPRPKPCAVCSKSAGTTQGIKRLCGICTKAPAAPVETQPRGPCGICKKAPSPAMAEGAQDLCKICKKYRAPRERPKLQPCGICSKPKPPNAEPFQIQPPTPIIRTCLLPMRSEVPIEPAKPKIFKALPQHKAIHICSPCHYDPSPLIDAEGNVFCPHNCGCCLCPWLRRATDSQIDQIKHEKIKVCKCRLKGSIFADNTSRAKCSNTSNFDCCPCRERAEAKYLEMTGEQMWSTNDRLGDRIRGEPVNLEDVVEYMRGSTT